MSSRTSKSRAKLLVAARGAADAGHPNLIRCGHVGLAWDATFGRHRDIVRDALRVLPRSLRVARTEITRGLIADALGHARYRRRPEHSVTIDVSSRWEPPEAEGRLGRRGTSWRFHVRANWIGSVYRRLGTGIVEGNLILESIGNSDGKEFFVRAVKQSRGYQLRRCFATVTKSEESYTIR